MEQLSGARAVVQTRGKLHCETRLPTRLLLGDNIASGNMANGKATSFLLMLGHTNQCDLQTGLLLQ